MVGRLTPNREVLGSIPIGATVLCRKLVKPRKRRLRSDMAEKNVDWDIKP